MQPNDTTSVAIPGFEVGNLFSDSGHYLAVWWPNIVSDLKWTWGFVTGLSFVLSLFLIIGIVYSVERLKVLRKKESAIYDTHVDETFENTGEAGDVVSVHHWQNVVKHIESPNESDWKQALIEADIILDDLLSKMGYRGASVGEKLKRVESGDFKSLQDAWDAHLIRNKIAHEAGFTLNKVDAQHAFHLYKKVFEEFYFI